MSELTRDEYFAGIQNNIEVAEYDYREETGRPASFDLAMVEWIERKARAFAAGQSKESRAQLYSVLASAFAECLRRSFDGQWVFVNGEWFGIYIEKKDLTLNPWKKIAGALSGEEGESPVGMFHWTAWKIAE
jgi:hypothetical protein